MEITPSLVIAWGNYASSYRSSLKQKEPTALPTKSLRTLSQIEEVVSLISTPYLNQKELASLKSIRFLVKEIYSDYMTHSRQTSLDDLIRIILGKPLQYEEAIKKKTLIINKINALLNHTPKLLLEYKNLHFSEKEGDDLKKLFKSMSNDLLLAFQNACLQSNLGISEEWIHHYLSMHLHQAFDRYIDATKHFSQHQLLAAKKTLDLTLDPILQGFCWIKEPKNIYQKLFLKTPDCLIERERARFNLAYKRRRERLG